MNDEFLKDRLIATWTEHKPKVIIALALLICFVAGYGTGRVEGSGTKPTPRQLNYTTNKALAPTPSTSPAPTSSKTEAPKSDCKIKGNIGSGNKKTYHIQGGAFYDRTNAEMCFSTEQEAVNAGFTKSSR